MSTIRFLKEKIEKASDKKAKIDGFDLYMIRDGIARFENILGAELSLADLYLVSKKGGLDTSDLIANGEAFFPDELPAKVPHAIPDAREAMKCIAYELPTAAGFHLHRANESVLHVFYDAVTSNSQRPKSRNIGDYLAELDRQGIGDVRLKSCLRDLKDLHRNPLIHPEHSLESVDEALALWASIRAAVTHMLKEIPNPHVSRPAMIAGSSPIPTALPSP